MTGIDMHTLNAKRSQCPCSHVIVPIAIERQLWCNHRPVDITRILDMKYYTLLYEGTRRSYMIDRSTTRVATDELNASSFEQAQVDFTIGILVSANDDASVISV